MGWHTATQRSAARTIRKSEEVIWLMEVEARYSAHTSEEKGHSRRIMVLIRRGKPELNHLYPHLEQSILELLPRRKHMSAMARLRM